MFTHELQIGEKDQSPNPNKVGNNKFNSLEKVSIGQISNRTSMDFMY